MVPGPAQRRWITVAAVAVAVLLEWWGLMLGVRVPGPQMTRRHTLMLLPLFVIGAALATDTRLGHRRWPALAGVIVAAIGVGLPYGTRPEGDGLLAQWSRWSGPSWTLLAMFMGVLWTGLARAAAPPARRARADP